MQDTSPWLFWAPNGTPFACCHLRAKKVLIFRAHPLPMALVKDLPASKSLRSVPYKQQVHKWLIPVFYSTISSHSPTQPTLYTPNINCALSSFEADAFVMGGGGGLQHPTLFPCVPDKVHSTTKRRHGSTRVKKRSARRNLVGDDCFSTTSTWVTLAKTTVRKLF